MCTVNVGTLRRREGEVVETISRRNVDVCCLQEVHYRKDGACIVTGKDSQYKLFWSGDEAGSSGVAIMIAERWINNVIRVDRVNERIMSLGLLINKRVVTIVSAYAPQQGLPKGVKDKFYETLTQHMTKIGEKDLAILGADLNGHVGKKADGYESVHGGFGYGTRNPEGERVLDFALSQDMVVTNTYYKKRDSRLITYQTGQPPEKVIKTQVDYILVRAHDKKIIRDVKVIPGEEIFLQHRMVVCDLGICSERKKERPYVPKLKVWKLKDPDSREKFATSVTNQYETEGQTDGVQPKWSQLKRLLHSSTEAECGWTKKPRKKRVTWWWNETVNNAVKEKRRVWKESKKGNCTTEAYKKAKCKSNWAAEKAQAKAEAKRFGNLSTCKESRDNAFRAAKEMKAQNRDVTEDSCVKNDKGDLAFSDEDKLKAWNEHYEKLLNEEFPWDEKHLDTGTPKEGPAPKLTREAVQKALLKMKDGKAAGGSGIVAEMLKAAGETGLDLLTDLLNSIIHDQEMPCDWDMSVIKNCYKGKGDALVRGNYRGLKLLEHPMKLFERVIEQLIRESISIDDMQFGFMPGRGTTDAIFIVRQVQEKYIAKGKDLYLTFVDLEKAFDRVPRKVVDWALRKVGVEEWIIKVVMAMYENCESAVNINGTIGKPFSVKVGVHQGSVLSPLLFVIVMEALSNDFKAGLPYELLYADDLVLMAESIQELETMYTAWKEGMEKKGLRVNIGKTKVMVSNKTIGTQNKSGKWPCGVCRKGVGEVSAIQCNQCNAWIHKKCSKIKGSLTKAQNFMCSTCKQGKAEVNIPDKVTLAGGSLEVVAKFCYLGDMLDAGGGAQSSTITRVQCGWNKFRELQPLLTSKATTPKTKGQLYKSCVQRVMIYGSETWPVKTEDTQRLHRNEMIMVRLMCGVSRSDRLTCKELWATLGIDPITDVMRRERLRWFGHTERKDEENYLRKVQTLEIPGKVPSGGPRKTWKHVVDDDLRRTGLDRAQAQNRDAWRFAISKV